MHCFCFKKFWLQQIDFAIFFFPVNKRSCLLSILEVYVKRVFPASRTHNLPEPQVTVPMPSLPPRRPSEILRQTMPIACLEFLAQALRGSRDRPQALASGFGDTRHLLSLRVVCHWRGLIRAGRSVVGLRSSVDWVGPGCGILFVGRTAVCCGGFLLLRLFVSVVAESDTHADEVWVGAILAWLVTWMVDE